MGMTWTLAASTEYTAGEVLQGVIYLTSPEEGVSVDGYILGALYEVATGNPILNTRFNVDWDADLGVGVNEAGFDDPRIWSMPTYGRAIPFRFTLDRSDVILKIWDLRLEGVEADPETDEILSILQTSLATPVTPVSSIEAIMPPIMMIMVMGMVFSMLGGMTK